MDPILGFAKNVGALVINDVITTSNNDNNNYRQTAAISSYEPLDNFPFKSGSASVTENTPKVFISYSSIDLDLQKKLNTALSALKRKRKLNCWTDQEIMPGNEWNKEIMEKLEQADIVLLLISFDFIASDVCMVTELKIALQRHNEGKAKVILVILRPCQWKEGQPFSHLQGLPKGGKPITTWDNQDEAFLDIANELETVLNEI